MERRKKSGPRGLGRTLWTAGLVVVLAAGCAPADTQTLGSTASNEKVHEDGQLRSGGSKREAREPGGGGEGDRGSKPGRGQDKAGGDRRKPVKDNPSPPRKTFRVTDVTDGDTIEVGLPSGSESVRLIGVDTPETVHPTEPVECFGPRASDFTSNLLSGELVRLEFDDERRDHYGRLLAYVWLHGVLFNERLVRRGFASVTIYSPNDEHADLLYAAESRARSRDRGLWAACSGGGGNGGGKPKGTPDAEKPDGSCDGNYKGACVPRYPPDINCADVPATNFKSVGSDPHGFDGDDDGIACEG